MLTTVIQDVRMKLLFKDMGMPYAAHIQFVATIAIARPSTVLTTTSSSEPSLVCMVARLNNNSMAQALLDLLNGELLRRLFEQVMVYPL